MNDNSPENLQPIFFKIPPEEIVYLKSILEGYDYLGIIRTLNKETGEIVILALEDTVGELRELLGALKGEVNLREIPRPESVSHDWLLTEYGEQLLNRPD